MLRQRDVRPTSRPTGTNVLLRFVALAFAALCPSAVSAQTKAGTADKPPETTVLSPGGVDMVTGRYRSSSPDLSIGNPDTGGIVYERREISRGNAYLRASNWFIGRSIKNYTVSFQNYAIYFRGLVRNFEISAHAPSFFFTGYYDQGRVTLERVNGALKFTDNDGTIVMIDGPQHDGIVRASSVTHPNGVVYSLHYDSGGSRRLRRVISNAGYQLVLEYPGSSENVSKACVFNTSQIGSPASPVCPAGVQTATYGYDAAGTLASVTTPDGSTRSIVTTAPSGDSYTESFFKPGYSQPELVNTYTTVPGVGAPASYGHVVGAQTFGDGRTLSYQYDDYNDGVVDARGPTGTARGGGWIENGEARTSLTWERRRSMVHPNDPAPLFIGPAPQFVKDPLGRTIAYNGFDGADADGPFSHLIAHSTLGNHYETYTYDVAVMLTRTLHSADAADPERTISFGYSGCAIGPACARPTSVTDARGNTTHYTYDPVHGGILTETAPAAPDGVRPQKRYAYTQVPADGGGAVWLPASVSECRTLASCAGTADERVTSYSYGPNLLPAATTVASGDGSLSATTSWTYDASGDRLTEDGPAPGAADTTRWRYDAMRRVVGMVAPDPDGVGGSPPAATRSTYDPAGRLTKVERGTVADASDAAWAGFVTVQAVETEYDIMDRKLMERTVAGGSVRQLSQFSYDSYGRLECTAIRMNPAAYGALPASACALGAPGADGPDRITRNLYDLAGQLVQIRKAVGTPVEQAYATYTYNAAGKQELVIDANGNATQSLYDGFSRLKEWRFPQAAPAGGFDPTTPASAIATAGAANAADRERYAYDANDNRVSLTKRDGRTLSYGYDALNRLVLKTVPDGGGLPASATRDVHTGYDLANAPRYVRFDSASGEGVAYGYDALGRQTSATTTLDGVTRTLSYRYDAAGNRDRLTHPDGVFFSQVHDAAGRQTGGSWWTPATGTVPFLTITYDALGRRTDVARAASHTGYDIDAIGRLLGQNQRFAGGAGDTNSTFGYNAAGQITSRSRSNDDYAAPRQPAAMRSYAANGLNQYTAVASAGYATSPIGHDANGNLTSDGSRTFTYDVENRLIAASTGASLRYDPLGRLWETAGGQWGRTHFLYDGDRLAVEYDGDSGAIRRRFAFGPGVDEPLLQDEGGALDCSGTRVLHPDHQGSLVAAASCAGVRTGVNGYDEHGVPAVGNWGRFGYTGQLWVPELGLWHYKARMYSPTLGRFLQTDPIGYDDGLNWYAYVANDPVNNTDPTGEETACGNKPCPTLQGGNPTAANVAQAINKAIRTENSSSNIKLKGADVAVRTSDKPQVMVTIRVPVVGSVTVKGNLVPSKTQEKVTISGVKITTNIGKITAAPSQVTVYQNGSNLNYNINGPLKVEKDLGLFSVKLIDKPAGDYRIQ